MSMRHLVMASLLLLGTASVEAQTIFSANFSEAQGYTEGPLVGQPANAEDQWVAATPDNVTDEFTVVDEHLEVTSNLTGGNWVTIPIEPQSGVWTITYDVQLIGDFVGGETGANINVCLSDSNNFNLDGNPVPTWNEQGAMIRLNPSGNIDVRNGNWDGTGDISAFEDFSYLDGRTVTIRAEIDVTEEWINAVWASYEGETDEVLLAEFYGFRRSTSNGQIDTIVIAENGSDGSADGLTVIIDNIEVFGSEGPTNVKHWSLH